MDNLRFGTTARRRARRRRRTRRAILIVWALSTLGVGAPVTLLSALDDTGSRPGPLISPGAADVAGHIYLGRDKAHLDPAIADDRGVGKNDPRGPTAGASIEGIIRGAAADYGIEGDYLVSIAACESGLNPRAYNSAGYHGLFQYDEQTWAAYGDGSIWDPEAQARTTAKLLADGQSSRWPNCA